jgi:hypothetical protein
MSQKAPIAGHQRDGRQAPAADGSTSDCPGPAHAGPARHGTAWHARARIARLLAWASLAWMTGKGAIGLAAGLRAGSVSLIGWALGSVIEGSPRSL